MQIKYDKCLHFVHGGGMFTFWGFIYVVKPLASFPNTAYEYDLIFNVLAYWLLTSDLLPCRGEDRVAG